MTLPVWIKVDNGLIEHPKIARAATHLGPRAGYRRVVAVWLEALCYASRNLTNGFIPRVIVDRFLTDEFARDVMDVLAFEDVRLMRKVPDGYQVHEYETYQLSKEKIQTRRATDRGRKRPPVPAAPNSERIPNGIRTDSNAIDIDLFVPSVQRSPRKRGRALSRAACKHLAHLVHTRLDADPEALDATVADDLKDACARHGWAYEATAITAVIRSTRATRAKRATRSPPH